MGYIKRFSSHSKPYPRFIQKDKTRMGYRKRFSSHSKPYPRFIQKDKTRIWYRKRFSSHSKPYPRFIQKDKTRMGYIKRFSSHSKRVSPDPAKVEAVKNITSTNLKQLRSFLGLTGYYRRFIPQYATIAQPLTKLTSKECCNKFEWSAKCHTAFQMKNLICSAPIIRYPDFHREFVLQTDASDVGLGAVLSQIDEYGREHVVAYASKTLSAREINYSRTEKEAFAI